VDINVFKNFYRAICLAFVLVVIACSGESGSFTSPNNNIEVDFFMVKGTQPYYKISYRDSAVIDSSRLGLVRDGIDFSRNMSLESVSNIKPINEQYSLSHGKQHYIVYNANEKTFYLRNKSGNPMDITFRISNDGVAFRYSFPNNSDKVHQISSEKTSYHFPEDAHAWLEPLDNVNTGYAQTNPSYEEDYYKDIKVGAPAPDSAGWAYPALFKVGSTWALISESGMNGTYCGTRLRQNAPDGNYTVGFPEAGEQRPGGVLNPHSTLPWSTPWRIVVIGNLSTITESTLATDLADPTVDMDTSWIKPGRASWSWAKLKDASVNYDTQKRFVNYSAKMGWEYTLVDVNWDSTIGYDGISRLADYAAKQNVGLLLWYNSSGSWNNTTYSPKSKLLTHQDRVQEFSQLQKMGIKGIKVDFFGGDGQSMIQYYRDIFKDAAAYHLLVNTHGATIPRGWQRTWPNLMTMEAVKGFEYVTFEQANADNEAFHCAMLPFTRNVFGPMDFTPMSLTQLNYVKRKTTSAFELALPVLFTSGLQHYAETPRGMDKVPGYVVDFVKKIPVEWDEMKFIDGYPGKLVVIARRKGDRWFIAGINGEDHPKKEALDLSFLPDSMEGELISDGKTKFTFSHRKVTLSNGKLSVAMKGNGGFVLLLK